MAVSEMPILCGKLEAGGVCIQQAKHFNVCDLTDSPTDSTLRFLSTSVWVEDSNCSIPSLYAPYSYRELETKAKVVRYNANQIMTGGFSDDLR